MEQDQISLKKTPLYSEHIQLGAKMVSFAGWCMPLRYSSIKEEHLAVREKAGVFDVSHMGEIFVRGSGAVDFLNYTTCNNVAKLKDNQAQYSALLNDKGGVVDDIIVYRLRQDDFMICVNAVNKDGDFAWLNRLSLNFKDIVIEDRSEDFAQIALQGRLSQKVLTNIIGEDIASIPYFSFKQLSYQGDNIILARTGYTGEDGFEAFATSEAIKHLWHNILLNKEVKPCGLGARDSLRLEVCYPLHGHELSQDISALESGLGWVVKFKKGDFIGKDALLRQKEEGVLRGIYAFEVTGKGIARQGYKVFYQGNLIGFVTSGLALPYNHKAIGLALLDKGYVKVGSEVEIAIRNNMVQARIVEKPFYKRDY